VEAITPAKTVIIPTIKIEIRFFRHLEKLKLATKNVTTIPPNVASIKAAPTADTIGI